MHLTQGMTPPSLYGRAVGGRIIDVTALGGRPLWITFTREAGCAFTRLRMKALSSWFSSSGGAIGVVAIVPSTAIEVASHLRPSECPLPLICDPGRLWAHRFGLSTSPTGAASLHALSTLVDAIRQGIFPCQDLRHPFAMPADFLIDGDGNVHIAHYGTDYADHLTTETIQTLFDPFAEWDTLHGQTTQAVDPARQARADRNDKLAAEPFPGER